MRWGDRGHEEGPWPAADPCPVTSGAMHQQEDPAEDTQNPEQGDRTLSFDLSRPVFPRASISPSAFREKGVPKLCGPKQLAGLGEPRGLRSGLGAICGECGGALAQGWPRWPPMRWQVCVLGHTALDRAAEGAQRASTVTGGRSLVRERR